MTDSSTGGNISTIREEGHEKPIETVSGSIEPVVEQYYHSRNLDQCVTGEHKSEDVDLETEPRLRKLTERGKAYQVETLDKRRHSAFLALSKQIKVLLGRLNNSEFEVQLEVLESDRQQLDWLKEDVNQAQRVLDELLDIEEDKQVSYRQFDMYDREYVECRIKVTERIQSLERRSYRTSSVKSGYSGRSRRSDASARSLKLEAAAKSARLRTELAFLERENELKRLQLIKEIVIADAEQNAIKEILSEDNGGIDIKPNKLGNLENERPFEHIKQEFEDPLAFLNLPSPLRIERQEDFRIKPEYKLKDPLIPAFIPRSRTPSYWPGNAGANDEIQRINVKEEVKVDPPYAYTSPVIPAITEPLQTEDRIQNQDIQTQTLRELVRLQAKQTELSSLLIQQQRVSHLPAKEPPVFSGDAFDYPAFITAFDTIISENLSSNRDRLYFLAKYTKGKANDVVKGFLAVNSEDSYKEARKLLDQRFGNPVYVAEAYKTRMREWSQINEGDSSGLQEFSDFLVRCREAVKTVGSLAEIDSSQTLVQISAKLPSYCGVKWCRHAHQQCVRYGVRVTFTDFVKFVKEESELASDPIFSPDALKREKQKQSGTLRDPRSREQRNGSYTAGSFVTAASTGAEYVQNDSSSLTRERETGRLEIKCPLCEKRHSLDLCEDFNKRKPEERQYFVISKGLCFGCLKWGHLSVACQTRLTCEKCGKPHPTSLHGVKPKPRNPRRTNTESRFLHNTSSNLANPTTNGSSEHEAANTHASSSADQTDGVTTSMIVPVLLHHRDKPQVEVCVYALLDDASDTTFVTSSTLKNLGIEGPETTLKLSTMHGRTEIPVQRIDGLVVQRLDKKATIILPKTYSRESIPSRKNQIPTTEIADKWPHLERIGDQIPPYQDGVDVGILIGCNCPKALKPHEVIQGEDDDPYAVRTLLGWGIIGPVSPRIGTHDLGNNETSCHRIVTQEIGSTKPIRSRFVIDSRTKEIINPFQIRRILEADFSEKENESLTFSQEDRKFLSMVKEGIRHRDDGHYELPLPVRDRTITLPSNRAMALQRLRPLKKRLQYNDAYRKDYVEFMEKVIKNGYAEKVSATSSSPQDTNRSVWYIPHHGVYHPKKPNKIRVVFDCSAQYKGESLNKHLIPGPDLTNNLTAVLCRFRQESVAVMCDIEAMFYQVKVPEQDRDLLRFLWWEGGDTSKEPQEYRMTVHLFGAASSPGCSNFALKTTADDNEESLGSAPAEFLRRNFYVDDGLKSVPSVEEAIELVKGIKEICRRGGFNLHKFTSNRKEVIQQIPEEDRAEEIKHLDLDHEALPTERALGVQWCIESDAFKFTVSPKDRPCTRRGILSTVSSIFDPLGFVAPVLLEGKSILQELCRQNLDWDDPVPDDVKAKWLKWKSELSELQDITIARCYKPADFGKVVTAELHFFSDASVKGYGQCSYLRLLNEQGRIHCAFVIGKARVTPLKLVTVPRLELTAALVSVRVSELLKRELGIDVIREVFWTDSKVVLGYIANQAKRFHVFVANRVQQIQDGTSVEQWRYVDTKSNPADEASRGLRPRDLSDSKWLQGPEFLWKDEKEWPLAVEDQRSLEPVGNDPNVKKAVVMATETAPSWPSLQDRLKYFSDWVRAKRAVALCRRYLKELITIRNKKRQDKKKRKSDVSHIKPVTVQELNEAEIVILKSVQEELQPVSLGKLNPFTDSNGVIRVGGRLRLSTLPDSSKHPAILPRTAHIVDLLISHYHHRVHHQGRGITLNELRASGYWIVGASAAVSSVISKCVTCRKLRGMVQEQRMADLPDDRMEPAPPFTNCAVDYFGPFVIKEGRKELKRYGVLFTCMASRAVHLETAATLETDSFISALRRFICRRGPIRQLRSDQGTNFVGARRELKDALKEIDQAKIAKELQRHDCDWFAFNMNVPSASHMGGVWERQIRSVRNVLSALLQSNGSQLNDESLRTFMCEAEAVVNSRPLTVDSLNDPQSLIPLTPNHLLTMKTKIVLPPPGIFQSADKYSRKRWRRIQHLANEFWVRWRKEYLLTLQPRQKWTKPRRNMCEGDIVIIKGDDHLPRNKWQLARVVEAHQGNDGYVRTVKLAVADATLDSKGRRTNPARFLERPVQKLVLLQTKET